MATWTTRYNSWLTLRVTATESEVNVANNTSKVTVSVALVSSSDTRVWTYNTENLKVRIDGTQVADIGFSYDIYNRGTKTLGTWSRVVAHNSDGAKTCAVWAETRGSDGVATISQNLGLTTIARASIPTLSASSVPLGNSLVVYTNRKSTAFTHTIKYGFAGASGTIATGVTDSKAWTIPASLASQIPSKTSNGMVITVETYNGGTLVGTKTVSLTVTVPNTAEYNPVANMPTYRETNPKVSSGTPGIWVAGRSWIEYKGTFSLKYGATIKSVVFNVVRGGSVWNHQASVSGVTATFVDKPNLSGTLTVKMVVTDSRGRTATSGSFAFTPVNYNSPSLNMRAYRDSGTATTIRVDIDAAGTNLSSKNILKVDVFIKSRASSSWGTAKRSFTSAVGTIKQTGAAFTGYSEATAWDVRVEVSDSLTDPTGSEARVSTTKVALSIWRDEAVGIGKAYDRTLGGSLQVGGEAHFDNGVNFRGDVTFKQPVITEKGFYPRRISENQDLNDMMDVGFYWCNTNAIASTLKNTPSNLAFSLLVERHAGIKQTLTTYETGNQITWTRNFYSGSWGSWQPNEYGDTNWLPLSYQNGCTGDGVLYRKKNGIVTVFGNVKAPAARTTYTFTTIPTSAKPATALYGAMSSHFNDSGYPEQQGAYYILWSSGDLQIKSQNANSLRYAFLITYPS